MADAVAVIGTRASAETPRRRSRAEIEALVLAQLRRARGAVSAYDIADAVTAAGHRLLANQVYRTLDRLVGEARVHRIETLAAYVLARERDAACLVCRQCRSVCLLPDAALIDGLRVVADTRKFRADRPIVEVLGRCAGCATAGR